MHPRTLRPELFFVAGEPPNALDAELTHAFVVNIYTIAVEKNGESLHGT
jgi:hypothetical protein